MDNSCFYENGVQFECQQCSSCCRFDPGYVFISDREMVAIAHFLKLEKKQFIDEFCTRVYVYGELKFSIKERKNYDCVFWSPNSQSCDIYSVRPVQCSTFPFWPSIFMSEDAWKNCGTDCPGVGKGRVYSFDEINREIQRSERDIYDIKSRTNSSNLFFNEKK